MGLFDQLLRLRGWTEVTSFTAVGDGADVGVRWKGDVALARERYQANSLTANRLAAALACGASVKLCSQAGHSDQERMWSILLDLFRESLGTAFEGFNRDSDPAVVTQLAAASGRSAHAFKSYSGTLLARQGSLAVSTGIPMTRPPIEAGFAMEAVCRDVLASGDAIARKALIVGTLIPLKSVLGLGRAIPGTKAGRVAGQCAEISLDLDC